jgi:hypothetical protein
VADCQTFPIKIGKSLSVTDAGSVSLLQFRAAGTAGIVPVRAHAQPGPGQTPVRATCHDASERGTGRHDRPHNNRKLRAIFRPARLASLTRN